MKIAILLTCHNRKTKTLACLEALFACILPDGYEIDVHLVDDGSTDGTADAIRENFPQVNIIQGTGNLFWNRGMHLAWKTASEIKNYDFYLWLNDDTMLYSTALETIFKDSEACNHRSIICGVTCSPSTQEITYGGKKLIPGGETLVLPNGEMQQCNFTNGNFLLVPKVIYKKIGYLDPTFRHAIGDLDYGLRARSAGFKNYITSEIIGFCEKNPTLPKWCLKETPLLHRFKVLYSPLGYAEPIPFFIYEKRHFGILTALKHFISINLRALFPKLWK